MGLFNTHHHHHTNKTEHVPYAKTVNVTEKRAATDESVRLLNEMEEKARKNIIDKMLIKWNSLEVTALFFNSDPFEETITVAIRFCINGTKYEDQHKFKYNSYRPELSVIDVDGVRDWLCKKISEAIADQIRATAKFDLMIKNMPKT